jgi:hypothetical protein
LQLGIRPLNRFNTEPPVTFADISWEALVKGEIAIGYRNNGEVTVNPSKSKPIEFFNDGAIIVLSED